MVDLFDRFLTKNPLFKNKAALQSSYVPSQIFHREEQINQLAAIIAPCLKNEKPSNVFIYGKTGTGKTLVARHVADQLRQAAKERDLNIKVVYLNCKLKKVSDTEYRLFAQLAREFGKAIPPTGLPTEEVYNAFFSAIDSEKQTVILVLDEIDQLAEKQSNEVLYNLTRINSELKQSTLTLIGITNNLAFTDNLDPRIKSSLSEEELVFPPYNALQIQQILRDRAAEAFFEGCVGEGTIEKCAAYAAREHGDARRALELLRVAGELAERAGAKKVTLDFVDRAEEKIERDRMFEMATKQPQQHQAVLYAVLSVCKKDEFVFTGEVYERYKSVCAASGMSPLTQRRVSDIIAEFDMLGVVTARVISKGRYGRTREIAHSMPEQVSLKIKKALEEALNL